MKSISLISFFLCLCFSLQADKPNIVFILADDLGYGDLLQTNPNSKNAAPHIDKIAKEGMYFTDMHSPASWCVPSRYGLLTATYPHRNKRNWRNEPVIAENELTLPNMFKNNGYETCMIGKWHLGFSTGMDFHQDQFPGGPYHRGFDSFYGLPHSLDIEPYLYIENDKPVMKATGSVEDRGPSDPSIWTKIQGEFWRKGDCAPNFKHEEVLDVIADRSAQKIKTHAAKSDKPLFLYVPLTAPHTPWLPAERFLKNSPNGLYGAFVAHVDDCIRKIDEAIAQAGIKDNTIIIITSDNGPVWYDKDEERTGHKSRGVTRGMKGDTWEGGHRVPFIVRWPAQIQANSKTESLSCFIDMMPTFAQIVGDASIPSHYKDGISLGKDFQGGQREELLHLGTRDFKAIRSKEWKYIPFIGSGGFSSPKFVKPKKGEAKGQLYNLKNDPGEKENLYFKHPELVQKLEKKLSNYN